jgi:methylglyoxal synthase
MTGARKVLGMIASDLCEGVAQDKQQAAKPWVHIREFIKLHYGVLAEYEIKASDGAARIIKETVNELRSQPGFKPLTVEPVGEGFRGIVRLAALVAQGNVERVLSFEDPKDVEKEHPENYTLLQNCNLSGKGMLINEAAHLWAQSKEDAGPSKPRVLKVTADGGSVDIPETVVFIAHDGEKERMARLLLRYRIVFREFPRLLATPGTKRCLDKFLEKTLPLKDRLGIDQVGQSRRNVRGPRGGDVIVADEIFRTFEENPNLLGKHEGPVYHVLFFIDHRGFRSPTLDTRLLMRTCTNPTLRVNLLFNSRMAEEWLVRYIEP